MKCKISYKKSWNKENFITWYYYQYKLVTVLSTFLYYFLLSKKYLESTVAAGKAWDDLGITATNLPGQDIVLIEQLDKELIQKLSVDQFDSLMKTLIENPVNVNRITKPI